MNMLKKIFGPRSKYIKEIPYTYEARVDVLQGTGDEPVYNYYYADTVCGLIDYLDSADIDPEEVEIFEVYQEGDNKMKTELCITENKEWLSRPGICKSLRGKYIGHIDEDHCAYRDRNREGSEV